MCYYCVINGVHLMMGRSLDGTRALFMRLVYDFLLQSGDNGALDMMTDHCATFPFSGSIQSISAESLFKVSNAGGISFIERVNGGGFLGHGRLLDYFPSAKHLQTPSAASNGSDI